MKKNRKYIQLIIYIIFIILIGQNLQSQTMTASEAMSNHFMDMMVQFQDGPSINGAQISVGYYPNLGFENFRVFLTLGRTPYDFKENDKNKIYYTLGFGGGGGFLPDLQGMSDSDVLDIRSQLANGAKIGNVGNGFAHFSFFANLGIYQPFSLPFYGFIGSRFQMDLDSSGASGIIPYIHIGFLKNRFQITDTFASSDLLQSFAENRDLLETLLSYNKFLIGIPLFKFMTIKTDINTFFFARDSESLHSRSLNLKLRFEKIRVYSSLRFELEMKEEARKNVLSYPDFFINWNKNLFTFTIIYGSEYFGTILKFWFVPETLFYSTTSFGFEAGVYEENFMATIRFNYIYDPLFPFEGLHRLGFYIGPVID